MIPGEPYLTGALPRTRVIPRYAPPEPSRPRPRAREVLWESHHDHPGRPERPVVAERAADTPEPGQIAFIRTRLGGIKSFRVRLVRISATWANHGRPYVIGTDPNGLCHRVWGDRIVSVRTPKRPSDPVKTLKVISR